MFRATEVSHTPDKSAREIAWSKGSVISCAGYAYCANDCFVTDALVVEDKNAGTSAPLKFKIADKDSISMSADCKRISFRSASAPPNAIDLRETWDVPAHTLLRKSTAWQVAGGVFDANLVPSGNFLQWSHSRGNDLYEEVKSGVKGPQIGLSTKMSPDERFIFIGGGNVFGTDRFEHAKLIFAKNGKPVYDVPTPKESPPFVGVFCATANLLATIEPHQVAIRATDDPKILATLPEARQAIFSPDGAQLATLDEKDTIRVYKLERCAGDRCAPISDCKP